MNQRYPHRLSMFDLSCTPDPMEKIEKFGIFRRKFPNPNSKQKWLNQPEQQKFDPGLKLPEIKLKNPRFLFPISFFWPWNPLYVCWSTLNSGWNITTELVWSKIQFWCLWIIEFILWWCFDLLNKLEEQNLSALLSLMLSLWGDHFSTYPNNLDSSKCWMTFLNAFKLEELDLAIKHIFQTKKWPP